MFFCLSLWCSIVLVTGTEPQVNTNLGVLRGVKDMTWNKRIFNSFTGIPYAEPPVGELRFKPPVPKKSWREVLDASKPPPMCTQFDFFLGDFVPSGSEDCLYLNVYTPQVPEEKQKLLPVLFFIHGGGFMNWKSNYFGPKILMDKDVVLVTTNYRLGAFGFLSTGDLVVPGNNGLKDQNLAIKWVKGNIANFGGDPNLITIFGQSAGGASAHFHMLSPLSKDMIHGVIAHSGNALASWALGTHETIRNSKKLAQYLNCPTNSTQEMVDCLRTIDAYEMAKQNVNFFEWSYDPVVIFKPVIEADHTGAFLTEHPVEIIKSGKAADVPYVSGMTTEEGAFKTAAIFNDSNLVDQLDKDFNRIAPITLSYGEMISNRDEVSKMVRKFYFGDKQIDDSTKNNITNMYTDFWELVPLELGTRLHLKYSKKPVYYYLFGYKGSTSFSKIMGDDNYDYGVCHCDELLYLFNLDAFFSNYEPTDSDKKIIEAMTTMWVNFAATGNPTPEDDLRFSVKWRPVVSDKLEYYFITSSNMTMEGDMFKKRSEFCRTLILGDRIKRDEL